MASIQAKKGKKGISYYVVYSYQEKQRNGSIKNKLRWLKAGDTKSEAEVMLREFKEQYRHNRNSFNKFESIPLSDFIHNEFLPWCKARKSEKGLHATRFSLETFSSFFRQYSTTRYRRSFNRTVHHVAKAPQGRESGFQSNSKYRFNLPFPMLKKSERMSIYYGKYLRLCTQVKRK